MSQNSIADTPTAFSISDDQIRERAHDIWERHHRPQGFEMHFWLMAKRELLAERQTEMTLQTIPDGATENKI